MQAAENTNNPPTHELRQEHRVIEKVLRVLDVLVSRTDSFEAAALRDCVSFFRLFADACHHGKEEDMLFPVLEQGGMPREGGPIGVMLQEHTIGRRLVGGMAETLPAAEAGDAAAQAKFRELAREYVQLLTQHIWKEDNVLFNMSDQVIRGEAKAQLSQSFCDFRCKAFEGKRREELENLAESLVSRWLGSA